MLVMCTITSVSALEPVTPSKDNSNNDPSKIESDLYVNGSREAAGEIFYEPGKNTVNSKVKFFMNLGLIDHYYLGYSVTAYLDDDDNIVSISVDENRNNVGVHMAKAAEAFLTGYNGFAGGCTNCKFEV